MANSKKEDIKTTETKRATPQLNTSKNVSPNGLSKSLFIGLTFILSLVAIILAVYTIGRNQQFERNLSTEKKHVTAQINEVKQLQSTIENTIDAKSEALQKDQASLSEKLNQLNTGMQTTLKEQSYQNQDWLLLKARYYLELSQINSHWSTSYNASVALLQEADNLLKQLNDTKVLSIRQAIAKEIAELKAAPSLDIAGLLSQLDAAQNSVSTLAIQSALGEPDDADEDQSKVSNTPGWNTQIQESVKILEKLVVVRRHDEEIKPLLSPLFESILRESIRLNLQEAQWAILNNNPAVYELSLKQATMNLKRAFNGQSKGTKALIQQINELQKIKISQEQKITSEALPLLNQLIDRNDLLNKPSKQDDNGEGA